jgi:ATP-dependent DNA helicase RecQ
LLSYFGEAAVPCGNCDNCLAPPETWDATVAAQKALSAVYRTGQRFGAVHVIDVLLGRDTERVRRWGHERLAVYGIGAELDEGAWRDVFRQLVALGFAEVDHGAYGALRLTAASRPVLKGEQAVRMRRTVARPRRTKRSRGTTGGMGARVATSGDGGSTLPAPGGSDPAGEAARYSRLKEWRLAEARRQAVPAYVILHDATLAEIARREPRDLDALGEIPGIGARRLERYGAALLEVMGRD